VRTSVFLGIRVDDRGYQTMRPKCGLVKIARP
jgi:hypothetical protein